NSYCSHKSENHNFVAARRCFGSCGASMRVRAIILCLKFRFQLGLLKQHSHFSASRLITARIALWLNALAPSSPTVTCSSSRRRPNLRPERPRSRRQCRAGKDAATVLGSGTHPDAARYPTPPFSSGNGSGKFLMQSLRWCTGATIAFGVLLSGVTNWQPRSLLHTQRGNLAVDFVALAGEPCDFGGFA